ncbi:pilus assembly protein TadG-related protein [Qipengyuania thermophila]|uniref:pilus assembly protein TadG-related protein n=1 Tax=Qipengyuania thermophila TaxID=2509361 RepID=UPI0013EB7571|nr:pilus assembly protein TadG-related protein [Qipengyuania thermophila]
MVAITAAAIIPMIGVVGGAIDTSRLYLTKSRLQAACDSAVLAGRKAMTTNLYTASARNRANSMFAFNFQDADYGTTGTRFLSAANADGRLDGTASTNVPMTLMKMFGFEAQPLEVTCSADIQVPNIDIVFVLDVTGSMNGAMGSGTRLSALKQAAKDFADVMDAALIGNTRSQVRYGFVPYSQTVNGRDLFKANPDLSRGELHLSHLADTVTAESRVANFSTWQDWTQDPWTSPTSFNQTFGVDRTMSHEPFQATSSQATRISNSDCDAYSANLSFSINSINRNVHLFPQTSWSGSGRGASELFQAEGSNTWTTTPPNHGNRYVRISFSRVSSTWEDNNGATHSAYQNCVRRVTRTTFHRGFRFTNWIYRPVDYDTRTYKAGSAIPFVSAVNANYLVTEPGMYDPVALRQLPRQGGLTAASMTWNGCLEERDTVPATNFAPIPSGAKDLDIFNGGTNDSMRWRPVLPNLSWNRGTPSQTTSFINQNHSCPQSFMRNLNTMSRAEYDAYIDGLAAAGGTYHDIGLVWGLRMISPTGMFASRNLIGPNGGQISRHIIFLTDGKMEPHEQTYSSYGYEQTSQRIRGGGGPSLVDRHNARFKALCDSQRGLISIWAIAFGEPLGPTLRDCADPGRAYEANNAAELSEAFRRIAKEVADLRLVQ